jgi:hypothetical protein
VLFLLFAMLYSSSAAQAALLERLHSISREQQEDGPISTARALVGMQMPCVEYEAQLRNRDRICGRQVRFGGKG